MINEKQLFIGISLVLTFILGGCKTVVNEELVSPDSLYSTPNIAITDSGRIFVASDSGLYELLGDESPADLQLVTEGSDGESCRFFGLKSVGDLLYATCAFYKEKLTEPPGVSLKRIINPPTPNKIAIFEITLNELQYSVRSAVLPYERVPRNLALLDDDTLIVAMILRDSDSVKTPWYKVAFSDSDEDESLDITSIENMLPTGKAHSLLIRNGEVYHSINGGQNLKVAPIDGGQLGYPRDIYKPKGIPFTSIVANMSLFEGNLVVTQESYTAPFGNNMITLLDIEENKGDILSQYLLAPNAVASNSVLKRIDDKVYAFYVSFYNGGVYKQLVEE